MPQEIVFVTGNQKKKEEVPFHPLAFGMQWTDKLYPSLPTDLSFTGREHSRKG
jgi:hypothetical protein